MTLSTWLAAHPGRTIVCTHMRIGTESAYSVQLGDHLGNIAYGNGDTLEAAFQRACTRYALRQIQLISEQETLAAGVVRQKEAG